MYYLGTKYICRSIMSRDIIRCSKLRLLIITLWREGAILSGGSLQVDSESFWVASEVPLQVISSSVVGGDLKETNHILSVRVPADPEQREYALRRPRAFVRDRARALGINGPVVGLITGLDHERLQVATYDEGETKVAALATEGLAHLSAPGRHQVVYTALATEGLAHLSAPGRHQVVYTGEAGVGTINQVLLIDGRLAPTAAVGAATLATEAKTLALFEAGVKTEGGSPATGTSMDTMVVAPTGRGLFSLYAGPSTLVGHLIGQAVYDTVAEGVRLEQAASGNP